MWHCGCNTAVLQHARVLHTGSHHAKRHRLPRNLAYVPADCIRLLQVVVDVRGQQLTLAVLAVLEFNSDRKRMSMLCRLPDGR